MTNRPLILPPPIPQVSTDAEVIALIDEHDLDSEANADGIEATANATYIKSFVDEDFIGGVIGKQLVAYCQVNPKKGAVGEFTYRHANRRGLKVFWATGGSIYLERSDAGGDDFIGTADWVIKDGGWMVTWNNNLIAGALPNPPVTLVPVSFSGGVSPNTGLAGYMIFQWLDRNGSVATASPTTNDNQWLSFDVWKYTA